MAGNVLSGLGRPENARSPESGFFCRGDPEGGLSRRPHLVPEGSIRDVARGRDECGRSNLAQGRQLAQLIMPPSDTGNPRAIVCP